MGISQFKLQLIIYPLYLYKCQYPEGINLRNENFKMFFKFWEELIFAKKPTSKISRKNEFWWILLERYFTCCCIFHMWLKKIFTRLSGDLIPVIQNVWIFMGIKTPNVILYIRNDLSPVIYSEPTTKFNLLLWH